MGVVAVPDSASRTVTVGFVSRRSRPAVRAITVAFKSTDRPTKCSTSVLKGKRSTAVPLEQPIKDSPKKTKSEKKLPEQDLDYNEVAAVLENIYKLSPNDDVSRVVRSRKRRAARKRKMRSSSSSEDDMEEEAERLIRDYSASTDLVGVDWRKMKIPQVLRSSEQACLFKLMQPMKAIFEVKEKLQKDSTREHTDGELAVAVAVNMSVPQMRRHIEVGQAARNKLIKHNLRLVLFVINKYFQQIATAEVFQDLCQAGAKGLITAIDRFEPKRGFRLSTYALFWIRHSIVRSMTVSSFTRVSFGIESVRQEIQKAKLELMFEIQRLPTEEEIIARVGISPQRYHDVMKASKSISSLNARHIVTQEEFINGVTDIDSGGDQLRQPALLRLALDDVLDSLKPKESLVIRQRYGLDGKGNRTLGEIAGNLNISREMVRKHELKAFMKLKHPARLDYLRRYI